MNVDEKTGLALVKDGEKFFFCSEHCRKQFAGEHHLDLDACCAPPFYQNKIFALVAVLAVVIALSYFVPLLQPFRETLFMYIEKAWWATLLGLVLGGIMDHFVPQQYISQFLAASDKRTIVRAVLFGFLMSICNHGILALSMQLYKKGASTSSVVAFLLASPWANFPLTLLLISFFGLAKALYIVLGAIVIAITTGLMFQILEKKGWIETNQKTAALKKDFSVIEDLQKRFRAYSFSGAQLKQDMKGIAGGIVGLSDMVLWWIILGMSLASLAGAYIPPHIFEHYMGPTFTGMLVTLLVATVIEVCSEGTSPLAFEIYRQTGALGNSFVFLMAGVVTDYTEIGLIWQNIGRKAAMWLPILTVPQVIVWGIIANIIF